MAEEKKKKKEKKEVKVVLERVYNIPLRKEFLKAPRYARTKRAVSAVKKFVLRHMKAKEIKIGQYLNLELWKHGIKNPPHHVKVNCIKDEEGLVKAELVGAPKEEKKEPEKKVVKKEEKEKPEPEKKIEEIKEVSETQRVSEHAQKSTISDKKKEEAKEIEKEEIKELKKEQPKVHAPKGPTKIAGFKEHRREMIPGR